MTTPHGLPHVFPETGTKPPQNLINGIYFAPAYVSSEGLTEEQTAN